MRKIFFTRLLATALVPALASAETVPEPQEQCPVLIAQVENRLEQNPPQDQTSVETAKQRLEKARQANDSGDAETCMEHAKAAFKALNKT